MSGSLTVLTLGQIGGMEPSMEDRHYLGERDVKRMVASYLDEGLASEQPTQIVVVPASSFVKSPKTVSQTSYLVRCGVLLLLWDVLALSWVYLY
jgi:hypothetical protein